MQYFLLGAGASGIDPSKTNLETSFFTGSNFPSAKTTQFQKTKYDSICVPYPDKIDGELSPLATGAHKDSDESSDGTAKR